MAFFGVLLQWANWESFAGWRLVFLTMLPIGLIVIKTCRPNEMRRNNVAIVDKENPIDYLGAILLVAVSAVFILSGSHLHGGEDSYTSPDALTYNLPMHELTIALLVVFVFVERRVEHPFVEFQHIPAEELHSGDHLQRDVPPVDDGDHDPGADHDRGGAGQVTDLHNGGAAAAPVVRHLAAGHRGVRARQVQPAAAADGVHAVNRVGVRAAGPVSPGLCSSG